MMRTLIFVFFIIFVASNAFAMSVIRDEEIETVLKDITLPIYKAAGLPTQDVKLYIINDEEINAFVPGGYNIFTTTGLLTFSQDPKVFAGVIAHEVGHITSGHVLARKEELQNLRNKMIVSMLLGAAAGVAGGSSDVGIGTMMAGSSLSEMQMYQYSRIQENSADSAALRYLDKAGVSNSGLLTLLEKFKVDERAFDNSEFSYMRTHPVSKERILSIKNYNNMHPVKENGFLTDALQKRFKRIVIKLHAFTASPQSTLRQFGELNNVDNLYAQSIAYYKSGDIEKSLVRLNKAIEFEPHNPYFYELKGQIYFEAGKTDEAIKSYATAYSIGKKATLIKLSYATVLIYAKKNIEKAVAILESLSDEDKENDITWRQLGMAYAIQGNQIKSNIAFAYEAALKGDTQSARKFVALVEKNSPNNLKLKDLKSLIEYVDSVIQNSEN